MVLSLVVAADAAAVASSRIVATLRHATGLGRRASIALSGGETPWRMLALLRPDDVDWTLIDIFQVDERVVPAAHPDRNLRRLREALIVPAAIHPMPVEAGDIDRAAADFAASLPKAFDVVQLGLGIDGHTASLVPGDPVLDTTADVAVTQIYLPPSSLGLSQRSLVGKQGVDARHGAGHDEFGASRIPPNPGPEAHRRMTLTFPVLNRARSILWIVTGAGKREILAALLEGKADIPANRIARDQAIVVADKAAAG